MRRRTFGIGALLLALIISSGCATMVNGRKQAVLITSEPPGAAVSVDAQSRGVTPLTVDVLRRPAHHVVHLEKEGFASQDIPLTRGTSGWLWADFALVADPGTAQGYNSAGQWLTATAINLTWMLGLDVLTGGAFTLPSKVHATLQPLP